MTAPDLLRSLGWLERPPADLRAELRAIAGQADATPKALAAALVRLARCGLNLDQLVQLDRALARLQAAGRLERCGLVPLRLAVLMDGTADYALPALRATGLRHGLLIETYAPGYGQALAEAASATSGLAAFAPEVALVASDPRSLGLTTPRMDSAAAQGAVATAAVRSQALVQALVQRGVTPLLQTLASPAEPWCGHLDAALPGSAAGQVAAYNAHLRDLARQHSAPVLDADALAGLVGRAAWFDAAQWHRAKIPVALDLLPLWADHAVRLLAALRGKARKCLVLDLDNTLWGGVIGDDGVEGIRLGQGSADGEAFLAIQAQALALRQRGVILAVVSKNEEAAARLPFRQHPEMLLREADIAVFLANWTDKATNIAHVAKALNIGLDALAFLDDNPAERARVRQMLPEVAVPELPEDPALYPALLAWSGLFETVALSADDAARAEQYRQNAARAVAMETIGDYDAYLASLDMVCTIAPFDALGRARIAQLVNKSNQFNLTTRRYTEADIAAIETDPQALGLQIRLTDRFGDNGMISVVILRQEAGEQPGDWRIDTWLMSCRVLERRVEEAVLAVMALTARGAGARRLIGDYLPTAKNAMVARHYEKLGFAAAGTSPEAGPEGPGSRFVLDLAAYAAPDLPMRLAGAALPPALMDSAA